MKRFILALPAIATLMLVAPASATGLYSCNSGDKSNWKTIEELEAKMTSEGWTVRRIKEDGGCYEAYGTNPEGQRVEAYYHPVTLEKHLVARRGEVLFKKEN